MVSTPDVEVRALVASWFGHEIVEVSRINNLVYSVSSLLRQRVEAAEEAAYLEGRRDALHRHENGVFGKGALARNNASVRETALREAARVVGIAIDSDEVECGEDAKLLIFALIPPTEGSDKGGTPMNLMSDYQHHKRDEEWDAKEDQRKERQGGDARCADQRLTSTVDQSDVVSTSAGATERAEGTSGAVTVIRKRLADEQSRIGAVRISQVTECLQQLIVDVTLEESRIAVKRITDIERRAEDQTRGFHAGETGEPAPEPSADPFAALEQSISEVMCVKPRLALKARVEIVAARQREAELQRFLGLFSDYEEACPNFAAAEKIWNAVRQDTAVCDVQRVKDIARLTIERDGAREREAELRAALKLYVDWVGALHQESCPKDDTCSCAMKPINDAVNKALGGER